MQKGVEVSSPAPPLAHGFVARPGFAAPLQLCPESWRVGPRGEMTDMPAGKALHDAIAKASYRRRDECAGWMLLVAPPPVPDTYRPLHVASVRERGWRRGAGQD